MLFVEVIQNPQTSISKYSSDHTKPRKEVVSELTRDSESVNLSYCLRSLCKCVAYS